MDDDLEVVVVHVETAGVWDVFCLNPVCGYWTHDVGESPSKGKAEAMARRHRLQISRMLASRAEKVAVETVAIPREAYDALVEVAAYVSRGRRYVDVEPYPDATARIALAALPERTDRD